MNSTPGAQADDQARRTASRTPRRTPRRAGLVALVAGGLLALSGCGSVHPGVAAKLGADSISHDDVDRVARALCSANLSGAAARGEALPQLATTGARQSALQVLIDTELAHQFGEVKGVEADQSQVAQALAQNESSLILLPPDRREDFRTALRDYAEGQLILIEIGRQSLAEQGRTDVPDNEAIAEGQRLLGEYVDSLDVAVDPRYGAFEQGAVVPGDTSLSIAVSESAKQAAMPNPSTSYISDLPASQKCS